MTFASSLDADRSPRPCLGRCSSRRRPMARVAIPQRVPNGLHGNWFPAS